MPFDEVLADRLRDLLPKAEERRMFGGVAFMERGHLVVGVLGDDLIARVGADAAGPALAMDGVRPFDFTGRPMAGWVVVGPDAMQDDQDLEAWVSRCRAFTRTLPPK